jgi:hypothetical protein
VVQRMGRWGPYFRLPVLVIALAAEIFPPDAIAAEDCIYERYVENAGWITGSPAPVSIMDEFLRIDLKVLGEDGSLSFETKYTRTSKSRDDGEQSLDP